MRAEQRLGKHGQFWAFGVDDVLAREGGWAHGSPELQGTGSTDWVAGVDLKITMVV
jgi:hypothetical protein